MKKIILITSLVFFSLTFLPVNATELEELRSQEARIEQMKTIISSFFLLAEKSDQKEIIENALREVSNKIDSIKERINNRIKEKEEDRRIKAREEMIRSLKEIMDNRIKEKPKDEEQQSKEITIEEMIRETIQKIRDKEQEIRDKERSKEEVKTITKQCGWCGCDCVEIYPDQICLSILCINYKYNCVYEDGECVLKEIDNGKLEDVNI